MVVNKCKQLYEKIKGLSIEGVTEQMESAIGVAVTERTDRSFAGVYKNAKQALEKAKEQNGGRIAMFS